jgi:WD40 repeat protein
MRRHAVKRLLLLAIVFALTGANLESAQKPARVDQYGDPLPDGAVARIGSVRLRAGDRIVDMRFTPDGKKIVTANRTTGIHVWDVATGKLLHSLPATPPHPWWEFTPFAAMVLSPDCTHVAELDYSSSCTVREIASGKVLFKTENKVFHERFNTDVGLMRFTPDGKTLAFVKNFSRAVEFREVATGKVVSTQTFEKVLPLWPPILAFAPDGKTVAMPGSDKKLAVFNVASGKQIKEFGSKHNEPNYHDVVFSPDGKSVTARSGCLEIWDVESGKQVSAILAGMGVFTPDGRRIVTYQGEVINVATGKTEQSVPHWHGPMAISPDSKLVAMSKYGIVHIWDLDAKKPLHDFDGPRGNGVFARFAPDGKTIMSTVWNYQPDPTEACFWDAATGKFVRRIAWDRGEWTDGAVSSDGKWLAYGGLKKKITVTDLATRKVVLQADDSTFVPWLVLTGDGKYLMATLHDHESPPQRRGDKLALWDTTAGKQLLDLRIEIRNLRPILDEPAGKIIVPQGPDEERTVTCYDIKTGRQVPGTPLTVAGAHSFAMSPNEQLLAVGKGSQVGIKVYRLPKGSLDSHLDTHGQRAGSMKFSPDGKLLAAAVGLGDQNGILVWDMKTGREVAHFKGHRAAVHDVNWSADNRRLLSTSADLTILVWDVERLAGDRK